MRRATRPCGFAMAVATLLLGFAMFAGCGATARRGVHQPATADEIPEEILDNSDPTVDISNNPSTSHGGCGGFWNACPDVLNPEGKGSLNGLRPFGLLGCLSCSPVGSTIDVASGGFLFVLFLLVVGLLRRSARKRRTIHGL